MNQIHPLAVVDPEAKLGDGNVIGPFCVIDKNVVIGDNNKLLNNVTLWCTYWQQQRVLPRCLYLHKATGFEIPGRGDHLRDW